MNTPDYLHTAKTYLAAGLSVLPASRKNKRPACGNWKTFQERLPTECELSAWFANSPDALCVLAGGISGNLEVIDFDNHGELYDAWASSIDPALLARLVIERTPSGGYHAAYRCECATAGNLKLAQGKRDSGKLVTLIETRGEGGLVLCAPTEGYSLIQGDYTALPTLTKEERNALIDAATELDERPPEEAHTASTAPTFESRGTSSPIVSFGRPGDVFNERGDIRPTLEKHGWKLLRSDAKNEYWQRPGKTGDGHSATFNGSVFNVFSSNAEPLKAGQSYSKFSLLCELEYGGDSIQAAKGLRALGYFDNTIPGVNISKFMDTLNPPPSVQTIYPINQLVEHYPSMREPIIHGFLRRGETMNIIAPPKTGKSWLVTDLALSVAMGIPWFGFPCEKGKVLLIDNELHPETSAYRIPKVIAARGLTIEQVSDNFCVENQRGSLQNIDDLGKRLEELKPYGFRVIIIDAFYRAMPKGTDENDNGTVAGVYNLLDRYAAELDCAFILIHHTTKGNQSVKAITDVGAGAGSQSRATDAHVVLRRHQEEGAVVMDAVVRSFKPVSPICLRWNWPVWDRAEDLDPNLLEGLKKPPRKAEEPQSSLQELAHMAAEFADEKIPIAKTAFTEIIQDSLSLTRNKARSVVKEAIELKLISCARSEKAGAGQQSTQCILKMPSAF